MIAIGSVMIATKAERRCQRKTTQTSATTMLSSISFPCRVEMEFLISCCDRKSARPSRPAGSEPLISSNFFLRPSMTLSAFSP